MSNALSKSSPFIDECAMAVAEADGERWQSLPAARQDVYRRVTRRLLAALANTLGASKKVVLPVELPDADVFEVCKRVPVRIDGEEAVLSPQIVTAIYAAITQVVAGVPEVPRA